MIAACPKCDAKYRVDEAKVGPDGARLRCAKCQAVFRVRAPGAPAPVATPQPEPAPRPTPSESQVDPSAVTATAEAVAGSARSGEAAAPNVEPQYDRERLVLVADPQEDAGKQVSSALSSWGLQTLLVHDGVEAMLALQRALPRVVILDAALPKMYGFQICEIVKRNESLQSIKVILVGAIHQQDRYRRPPSDLYGADHYIEQPELPDGLVSVLRAWGLPISEGSAVPDSATVSSAEAAPTLELEKPALAPTSAIESPSADLTPTVDMPAPSAGPAAAAEDGLDEERQKAARLARIIVSDIILYQGEKFEQAIESGNLLETLDSEIEEGRGFFRQRVSEEIRNEKDYLAEELTRVARERGMQ